MNQPLSDSSQSTFQEVSPSAPAAQGLSPDAGATRRPAWYRDRLLLGVLGLALAVDQASKELVRRWMEVGDTIPREGLLRLQYVVNTGSAFGLFQGQTLFLIGTSLLGLVFLVAFYRSHARLSLGLRLGVGLMLGGALGNLADRLILGGVTDFIAVGWWPNFNLADSSIVLGMTLVAVTLLRTRAAPIPRIETPLDGPVTQEQVPEAPGEAPALSGAEEPPDPLVDGRTTDEQLPEAPRAASTLSGAEEPSDPLPR